MGESGEGKLGEGEEVFIGNLSERKAFLKEMKGKGGKGLGKGKGKWAMVRAANKAKRKAERQHMRESGLLSDSEVFFFFFFLIIFVLLFFSSFVLFSFKI